MTLNPLRGLLCTCLLLCCPGWAQQPPAQAETPPAVQPPAAPVKPAASASIPAPREVPSEINTGRGFSIQPIYLFGSMDVDLWAGAKFSGLPRSGNLDIPSTQPSAKGFVVGIPVSKTSMLRASYFQMVPQGAGLVAPTDLALFQSNASKGDSIFTGQQVSNLKLSLDYLTYYFKRGKSEFRVKTLWEVQRVAVSTAIDILIKQPNGTFVPASEAGDYNIFYPSLGMGLEHTVGRHFRWEARASGMRLGKSKAAVGDADVSAAIRFGRLEFVGGGRFFYFRTSPQSAYFEKGTISGPYAGLRFYWRKERPTAPAAAPTTAGPTR